jgi:outer membrane protein TolC
MFMKTLTRLGFVALILTLLSLPLLQAQDTLRTKKLTFEQAWQQASQNSHVMKQAHYLQQEKDQAAKASKGLYLPKVGITASYMVMSDDLTLDLTPVKDAITPLYGALSKYGVFSGVPNPDPNTNQVVPVLPDNLSTQAVRSQLASGLTQMQNNSWDEMIQKKQFGVIAANFEWPIFVGGKIGVANKVSKIEQNEAKEVTRQKEGELMSELVERYYGLCLADQAVLVRQDVYKGMNQHLNDAQKMLKQGLISNAEVLHAQMSNAQAERELSKAKRTAIVLNTALNNTLASESDSTLEPVSELFYLDSIESIDYFKKAAIEKNPMLMQVESKKLLVKQNYNAEKADYFPSVALTGMYDIVNKDLSPYMPDWSVGVGMKWTLFDGTARHRKVKAACFKTNQVEEIKEKAEADISTMINKLYNELNMYREQLSELETAKSFAEEYLRVREKAFHEEMSNATEVVDANLAVASVRIERLQAMYYYDLSLAKLLQYAGMAGEFNTYTHRSGVKTESYKSTTQETRTKSQDLGSQISVLN